MKKTYCEFRVGRFYNGFYCTATACNSKDCDFFKPEFGPFSIWGGFRRCEKRDVEPTSSGGQLLCDDGQGNQLWLFPGGFYANRFEADELGDYAVEWSGSIEGWNVPSDLALN